MAARNIPRIKGNPMRSGSRMSLRLPVTKSITTAGTRTTRASPNVGKSSVDAMKTMSSRKSVAYFVVICVYLVFASICSGLFQHFERDAYLADKSAFLHAVNKKTGLLYKFIEKKFTDCNEDLSSCDQAAREDLFRRLARKTLLDIVNLKENLSVSINDQQDFWTFRNSFAFVICATTTIGYGTPSPRTTGGRVFVVILYIVGIPFTILAVLDAGKLFFMLERFVFRNTVYLCKRSFYGCKSFYNKLRPIVKPNRVEDFENPEEITLAPIVSIVKRLSVVSSTQDIVGARPKESVVQLRHRKRVKELRVKERVERLEALTVRQLISTAIRMWVRHKWMSIVGRLRGKSEDLDDTQLDQTAGHRDSDVPPVRVMVLNLVAFVFGGAMLYRHYEGWTYWQSVYYIFTSISTVGFGDLLPKDELFLLLQAFYTVLGLSLLSMFVSSVQEILVESLIQLIIQLEQQQCTRIDDDFTNNAGNYTVQQFVRTARRASIIGRPRQNLNLSARWWEAGDHTAPNLLARRWTVEETRSFLGGPGTWLKGGEHLEAVASRSECLIGITSEDEEVTVIPAVTLTSSSAKSAPPV